MDPDDPTGQDRRKLGQGICGGLHAGVVSVIMAKTIQIKLPLEPTKGKSGLLAPAERLVNSPSGKALIRATRKSMRNLIKNADAAAHLFRVEMKSLESVWLRLDVVSGLKSFPFALTSELESERFKESVRPFAKEAAQMREVARTFASQYGTSEELRRLFDQLLAHSEQVAAQVERAKQGDVESILRLIEEFGVDAFSFSEIREHIASIDPSDPDGRETLAEISSAIRGALLPRRRPGPPPLNFHEMSRLADLIQEDYMRVRAKLTPSRNPATRRRKIEEVSRHVAGRVPVALRDRVVRAAAEYLAECRRPPGKAFGWAVVAKTWSRSSRYVRSHRPAATYRK